jgi:TonB family protein
VQAIADDAAVEFGIRRAVIVLETERAVVPMTWGLLRPTILFPAVAGAWDEHCLRAVCRHELAHVRRGDWAVQLVAAVLTRVFWFNPVVWLAARWLRIESERACDDAVLNLGVDGPEYAADLLHVTRTLRSRDALLRLAPSAGGGGFERRIAAALDPAIERTPLSTAACLVVTVLLAAAAVPVAGFGEPAPNHTPPLLAIQRDVLRRFGGEERRFSIVAGDISFWKNRIEGRVELQARLNVDGSVSAVRIVEPAHPDLARAAETIVRHWRREPATVRGVAVEVPIRMTVDFRR